MAKSSNCKKGKQSDIIEIAHIGEIKNLYAGVFYNDDKEEPDEYLIKGILAGSVQTSITYYPSAVMDLVEMCRIMMVLAKEGKMQRIEPIGWDLVRFARAEVLDKDIYIENMAEYMTSGYTHH